MIVVLGGAAAGVAVGAGGGASDHGEVEVAISGDPSPSTEPATTDVSVDDSGVVIDTSGAVPTSTPTAPRTGRLYGGDVKLRPRPKPIGDEFERFQGRDEARLTVLTGPETGWYRVEIDGLEGWMYGGFVDDPSDPACALEWVRGAPRTVIDSYGNPIGTTDASSSGSKLFASGPKVAGRWPVILADGQEGSVDGAAIYEAWC